MPDDAAPLLIGAGKETGNIFEDDEWDIECIAKADEARALRSGINIEHASHRKRLVRNNADRFPIQPSEADEDIRRKPLVDFEKTFAIHDFHNHRSHIIWPDWIARGT